jgi:hypothetical protein
MISPLAPTAHRSASFAVKMAVPTVGVNVVRPALPLASLNGWPAIETAMLLAKDGQVAGVQDAIIDVVRFISGGSGIVAVQFAVLATAVICDAFGIWVGWLSNSATGCFCSSCCRRG